MAPGAGGFDPLRIKIIRTLLGKSQQEFAALIGVPLGTLRNWEQGRRIPEGAARALLKIIEAMPQRAIDVLSGPDSLPLAPSLVPQEQQNAPTSATSSSPPPASCPLPLQATRCPLQAARCRLQAASCKLPRSD